MNTNFFYQRYVENVSKIDFYNIGFKNIYEPPIGNVRVDIAFDASPIDLSQDINEVMIFSQYTIFFKNSPTFAHFTIKSEYKILTKHKSLDADKIIELVKYHQNDCFKHTDNKIISFDETRKVTIPLNCHLDPNQIAQTFAPLLYHERNQLANLL